MNYFKEENLPKEQLNILKTYKLHLFLCFYSILKNNSLISQFIDEIKLSDLILEDEKIIYESIIELNKTDSEISSVKVISFAKNKWNFDLTSYFNSMWNTIKKDLEKIVFSKSLFVVKDNSKKFKFFEKIQNLPSKLDKENFEEVIKSINFNVDEIRGTKETSDKKNQFDFFRNRVIKAIESKGNNEILGFKTYLTELDNLILGLDEESMNVIAARPGVGKTALILSIIANHILYNKDEKHILFFSLEMPSEQLIARLVSIITKVPLQNIRSGTINNEEFELIMDATNLIENSNFHIEDKANVTIFDIAKIVKKYNQKLQLSSVFIDYIQLINGPQGAGNGGDRRLIVDEISRQIKMIAKEEKLPLIALSQLNRSLENRTDKRPMLSDLRESGAIEQDADRIIFLYRDSIYADNETKKINDEKYPEDIAEIILAKNRNGPGGVIYVKYVKKNTYFIDADKEHIQQEIVNNIKTELQSYANITEQDLNLNSDIFDIEIKS